MSICIENDSALKYFQFRKFVQKSSITKFVYVSESEDSKKSIIISALVIFTMHRPRVHNISQC